MGGTRKESGRMWWKICQIVCLWCIYFICLSVVYKYMPIFLAPAGSFTSLNPDFRVWGQNLIFLAVSFHFSNSPSLYYPCWVLLSLSFLSVAPSFYPSFLYWFTSPSSLCLFTFPWTKHLGSFPGICFCPSTIGECNLWTFFMKPGETLQFEWSSMVCTFCGSLNP